MLLQCRKSIRQVLFRIWNDRCRHNFVTRAEIIDLRNKPSAGLRYPLTVSNIEALPSPT